MKHNQRKETLIKFRFDRNSEVVVHKVSEKALDVLSTVHLTDYDKVPHEEGSGFQL